MTTQDVLNKLETEHLTAERMMIQHFGDNKVKIITAFESSCIAVFVNDIMKVKYWYYL